MLFYHLRIPDYIHGPVKHFFMSKAKKPTANLFMELADMYSSLTHSIENLFPLETSF